MKPLKSKPDYYEINAEAGKRVKIVRERAKLTRTELAKRCFVSQSLISSVESGARRLTDSLARSIGEVCGVRLQYLLCIDEYPTEDERKRQMQTEVEALLKKRDFAEEWFDSFIGAIAEQLDYAFSTDEGYSFTRSDGREVEIPEASYKAMREEFFDFAAFALERNLQRHAFKSYRKSTKK